jgi:hypothetical protein
MKVKKCKLSFFLGATAMLLVAEMNFGRPVEARTLVQRGPTILRKAK